MRSDTSVTVTRDTPVTSRVTSRVTRNCDMGVTQRVSHATTTTPHHTNVVLTPSCGVCSYLQIQVQSVTREQAIGLG